RVAAPSRYFATVKVCEVSIRPVGILVALDEATSVQMIMPMPAVTLAPMRVKPYAHTTRAHGHRSGLRQSRPNESLSSLRKSSVMGFGSTVLHNSHRNHAATPIS